MKQLTILCSFIASVLSFGSATAETHVHEDGSTCSGDHAEATEHVHEDGSTCTGDHAQPEEHVHEDGSTCTGDHQEAEEHVHEDGSTCSGDHSAPATHVHEDGSECSGDHGAVADDGHNHAPGETCSGGEEVVFTVDQKAQKSLALVYGQPQVGNIASGQVVYGQLEVPSSSIRQYIALSKGLVKLLVRPGEDVTKGQALYTIISPEVTNLMTEIQNARMDASRLEAEVSNLKNRQKNLIEINVRNAELESQIVAKQNEVLLLHSRVDQSQKLLDRLVNNMGTLKDDILTVQAQADGEVGDIMINQGAWLEQGQAIMNIVPKNALEFKGFVYAGDDVSQMNGQLEFSINRQQIHVDGKLRVAPEVNPETRTKAVYFIPQAPLPAQAYVGQTAKLLLSTKEGVEGFLNVPQGAVVKVGVNDVVFVKVPEKADTFAMLKVQTLPAYRGVVPVKGIHRGDQIVVEGGNELKYAIPTGDGQAPKKSAGHFHADGKFHEGEH